MNKFFSRTSKVLCALLMLEAVLLCFPAGGGLFAAPVSAEEEISTAEELIALSEGSGDDSLTLGKTYVLTNDIDLSGKKMVPVQVFGGVFDGKGHTVKGFSYSGRQSGVGLFRTVIKGGEVRNLNLEVNMQPTEDMKNVGGIVGINYGLIKNCTVRGYILGIEAAGGIAGRNMKSGTIDSCVNVAEVHAMRRTGGIAGYNEGNIRLCENRGEINAISDTAWEIKDKRIKKQDVNGEEAEEAEQNIEKLIPDNMDLLYDDLKDALKKDQEVHYTGGIAGVNSGEIEKCENHAKVGYRHLGYKTGGIVGYERGLIDSCKNTGIVSGRKNVGGIAGQLEPMIKDDFSEDSFKRAQDEADQLVGKITVLQDSVKGKDDDIQEKTDRIRDDADSLRGSIYGYRDYYRIKDDDMEQKMRSHTSEIRSIVNGMDVNMNTAEMNDALKGLKNDLDDIDKLMEGAEKAASNGVAVDMTGYISSVMKLSHSMDQEIDTLLKGAQKAGKEYNGLKNSASSLRSSSNSFDDFLRGTYDSYKSDIRGTDDDLTARIDSIASNMDELSDSLKKADGVIRDQMDGITASIGELSESINSGLDEAREEIDSLRNNKSINDLYDDVSDKEDLSPGRGKITICFNEGDIISDINGGGIAGMVDSDLDIQSDLERESSGDVSLIHNKTKTAVIAGCRNSGAVTVKNDCAGGIAGSMDTGAVESSENFGPVSTTDGDYAGGIAGSSSFTIRDSFSMASVSGNRYVGGIAGYGRNLINNRALATISEGVREKYGAIAGDVNTEDSTVSGNIFVDESLGAINALTFENEAKAVSYEEFKDLPGVPVEARMMKVTFISSGEVVKTLTVPYGGSVPEEEYPLLQSRDNKFGVWETKDLSDVRQNTIVNALYVPYATTIASRESFPVLLITGLFHNDAWVSYEKEEEVDRKAALPEGFNGILGKYGFQIMTEFKGPDEKVDLRLLADDYDKRDCAAVRNDDGSFRVLETSRDGRYMVFPYTPDNGSGEFYILKAAPDRKMEIITGAVVLLVLILLLIFFVKKERKRAARAKLKESEEKEDPEEKETSAEK